MTHIDVLLVHRDDTPEARARLTRIRDAIASEPLFQLICDVPTGEEGLTAATTRASNRPRTLILQFQLPDMTGFQFITQLGGDDIFVIPVLEGNEDATFMHSMLELELDHRLEGALSEAQIKEALLSAAPKAKQLFDLFGNVVPSAMESVTVLVPETEPVTVLVPESAPITAAAPKLQAVNPGRQAKVITVMGARGGVGKTFVAVNLAAALASQGERVLLLDMSCTPGDFNIHLDENPPHNITDALGIDVSSLDDANLSPYVARHSRLDFRYLPSPSLEFENSTALDYDFSLKLIAAASGLADYVIIDTGLPRSIPTRVACDWASLVVFVTNRDMTRLLASKTHLNVLTKAKTLPPAKFKVLINCDDAGAEVSESEIATLLDHSVDAFLPCATNSVFFSINTGTPIVTSQPHLPVSAALAKLAAQIKAWTE